MRIGTKVNLLLAVVFLTGIFISGTSLSNVLQQKAQNEVTSKASVLMGMANSVREYTNIRVNPLLEPRLEESQEFIPESIPTYSTRSVFEILRRNEDFKDFVYKDATLNPTNIQDKADEFETNLVNQFRQDAKLTTLSGFRTMGGDKLFYSAQPFKIEEQRCLRCHSTPELAPKSQIQTYGSKRGFGWKLGEIVAAQIIYVPAEDIFESSQRSFSVVMSVLILVFAIVMVIINTLLRKIILQRIQKIAKVAEEVSSGNMAADFDKTSNDEIGALASAFNRMKRSLQIALELLNRTNYN